jgi:hypothetical protein
MTPHHKAYVFLFIFLTAFYSLFNPLRIDSGDGAAMYRVAESLVTGRGFAISVTPVTTDTVGAWGKVVPVEAFAGGDGYGKWGVDGRYYAKYGLGLSLAVAPVVGLARQLPKIFPTLTADYAGHSAMVWFNAPITALASVILFRLLRQFYKPTLALELTLIYGIGTFAFYYARSAFSEPLTNLLLLLALCAVAQKRWWLGGLALSGMLLVRQTSLLLVVPILIWAVLMLWQEGKQAVFKHNWGLWLPVVAGQLVTWAYNFYRFGNWREYGYTPVTWDTPLGLGLYSQLLSPGKGLFIFAPILITGVLGWPSFWRYKIWALLTLILSLAWLIPHSLYYDWSGGGGWGPRLLLPIVPLLLFPAGQIFIRWREHRLGRVTLALLIVSSVTFQVLGISANWLRHLQRIFETSANGVEYFQRAHYHWPDSPLLGQLVSIQEEIAVMVNPVAQAAVANIVIQAQAAQPEKWQTEAVGLLSVNVPDFWFVYFSYLGLLPQWIILVLLIGLLSATIWSAAKLKQVLAYSESA